VAAPNVGTSEPYRIEECAREACDKVGCFVEGEMAGVDDMNLGIGHVPSVGLGFGYR